MDRFIQMGKDLGYEGEKLQDFVKQQQDYERDERIAERELERVRIASQDKRFSYQDTPPLRSFLVCILNFDKTSKIFSKCNHLFGRHLGETHFVRISRAIT